MAEAADQKRGRDTMPRQGKVENVCKQWLVHEDGALAYEIQNKEIERHYGINRFNRRTVREDIPVAKVLQTDEEVRQQEERYNELQALRAQADEDEEIARRVMEEIAGEEAARQRERELHDEEIARIAQEKEKQKYERYLEKKREKDLKKERHILEKQLEQHMVDARLAAGDEGLDDAMQGMHVTTAGDRGSFSGGRQVNGGRKVTPGGIIEDDGDFSDFFTIPDHVDDTQKKVMQEMQDEELARLLQEQEHKRTKAEVDRNKLKEIEEQDERLAKIIQEQDKLRMKRAKQRKKQQQQEELRRQQQMTNNSPASRPLPDLPGQRLSSSDSPMPPVQRPAERTRLRRDSFLQGIDSSQIPPPSVTGDTLQSRQSGRPSRPIDLPQDSVQNVERWLAGTTTAADPVDVHQHMLPSPSPPGSYHSEEEMPPYRPPQPPKHVSVINTASPPNPAHRGRNQPDEEPCYAVSNTMYNIAAAIDPTYKRRQHQMHEETDVKIPVQLASSLPTSGEMDLEWDPNVRGSLRRPKGTWNPGSNYHSTEGSLQRDDSFTDEGPVLNPWQPVQGQRRSASDRNRRPKKSVSSPSTSTAATKSQKNNSSCKQQ